MVSPKIFRNEKPMLLRNWRQSVVKQLFNITEEFGMVSSPISLNYFASAHYDKTLKSALFGCLLAVFLFQRFKSKNWRRSTTFPLFCGLKSRNNDKKIEHEQSKSWLNPTNSHTGSQSKIDTSLKKRQWSKLSKEQSIAYLTKGFSIPFYPSRMQRWSLGLVAPGFIGDTRVGICGFTSLLGKHELREVRY